MAIGVRPAAGREATRERAEALAGYLAPTHLAWLESDPAAPWRELEASFVFGDVSGFTALSERLARRGRVGAETLTDAITAVFTAMDEAIRAEGGEILKFGGDAVLAMFARPRHEASAAAAALGMQDALLTLRVPGAPAEVRRLRMSAGVASGTAHLFLAGNDPRELIVAGPLASAVVEREGRAEAGEVLLSVATAAALPADLVGDAGGDRGMLLQGRPATDATEPPAVPTGADPTPGLPPHLRGHEPDIGEHRTVTVAFIQFKGSDRLLERDGPDALADALDGIVGATAQACRDWGIALVSSDVDRDGGKLILSAGAPVASPDDDDRMLHALADVVGREWPLAVRAGTNRGPVFTADIGSARRRVWSVMGDAVNLAARVMVNAQPGQVLATPSVLRRTRDDFDRVPVEPFRAKGKSGLIHAEAVGEARGARALEAPAATPLIGRDRELAVLRRALADARAGHRRVVELVGEPGIGKSRLSDAVRSEVDGMTVLSVQAGPYAGRTPYLAVRRMLREAIMPGIDDGERFAEALAERVRQLDPRLEQWLPLIGIGLGVDYPPTRSTRNLAPEFAQQRLVGAVGRLLDLALPRQPLVAIVEDAHWLDGGSIALLGYLLSQTRDRFSPDPESAPGYMALITRRAGASELTSALEEVTTIELEPLDQAAVEELLVPRSEEAAVLPAQVRAQLVARAQGNPLLAGELAAAARAGGDLSELPDSVEALMNARMDRLPRGDRRLLREASVLGNEVQIDLLSRVVGRDEAGIRSALGRLSDFLVPARAGSVRFSHALMHDAAYSALPFRRRRELHGRAGEAVRRAGAEGREELLAIHFDAARRWPEMWLYGRRAGELALARGAPREAEAFLRSAVTAARWLRDVDREELARVTEQLGDAAELAGSYKAAGKAYAKARKLLAGEVIGEAELLLKEGRLREESTTIAQALRFYSRGLDRIGARRSRDATSVRARLILAQGAARLHAGRHRLALPLLERAVREAERSDDQATLAHAYYLLEWVHSDLGNPEAVEYRDLALPIFERLGDFDKQGRVLTNLGVSACHEGRWQEAPELWERAMEASERAGDSIGAAFNLYNIAELRLEQGHLEEAETLGREALAAWRAVGYAFGIGLQLRNLGRIEMRRGNLELAGELMARGREALVGIGAKAAVCELDAYEAKRLLLAGDPAAAKLAAETIQDTARQVDVPPPLHAFLTRIIGLAMIVAGRREGGIDLLRESIEIAEKASALYDQALGLDALAEATGEDEPRRQATELFERLGVVDAPSTGL